MKIDFIVAGGGLAGCILAWTLRQAGRSVALFDAPPGPVCSRVAAGLYHPLTGRRLSLAWRLPELLRAGDLLFRTIEAAAERPCLHRIPIRRSFVDRTMAESWSKRRDEAIRSGLTIRDFTPGPDDPTLSPFGGYELDGCGWVDTGSLLRTVTGELEREGRLIRRRMTADNLESSSGRVSFGAFEAGAVVFAEGHLGRRNPLWQGLPLIPNHGEILEIRIDGPLRECIHLGELYLVPRGGGKWLAGATHDWTMAHGEPTVAGRRTLEDQLKRFLRSDFEVTDHRAGVRPASGDTMPFVGRHPDDSRIWVFNGFGSRALLLAPYCAELLNRSCDGDFSLPEEIDVRRFEKRRASRARPFRATRIAQERIAGILQAGDLAIDATAGRGHDTFWLAARVGPTGHVFACDCHPGAVEITRRRMAGATWSDRVTAIAGDHADLERLVPADWPGQVSAILFNLGPPQRGDPDLRNRPASTLKALGAAFRLLRPGGRMTIVLNPGDPCNREEEEVVRTWAGALPPDQVEVEEVRAPRAPESAPWVLVLTTRLPPDAGG